MNKPSLLTILRQHIYDTFIGRRGQVHLLVQLAVYAVVIGVMWPGNHTLNSPAQPTVFVWLTYLHTFFLGRLVLNSTSQAIAGEDAILPQEWLRYGYGAPLSAVLFQTLVAPVIAVVWTALSAPMFVTASLLHTERVAWGALAAYWLIMCWALAFWGTLAAITVQQQRHRRAVCNAVWTGFMAAALLLLYADGAVERLVEETVPIISKYNPLLSVHMLVTDPSAADGRSVYVAQLVFFATVAAAGLLLAVNRIWRWRERQAIDIR